MNERKTILITGANAGFGRLTAEVLAREGHVVFATMRGAAGKNASAAAELLAFGEREKALVHVLDLDVTSDASVEAAVATALSREGRLDVVVSNAGVLAAAHAEAFTPSDLRALFDVNTIGFQRLMRAALPSMRKRNEGLVVVVTSAVGRLVVPTLGAYCASKFALEALAEAYHYELAGLGIDVAIVEPGAYPTGTDQKALPPSDPSRIAEYGALADLGGRIFGTLGPAFSGPDAPQPIEVANAIARLVATPRGARPIRTPVGKLLANGVAEINMASAAAEAELFAATGVTEAVRAKGS